ncbi:YbjN domain-containing protein [Tengunoibacter tsumagoiensis]|uniref:YbjN domain-containing protein n=1 Tax=Tengunoibacter tsumagoiensis TaxID=2014871 RepID=A0A402A2L1_9CHLR|nr:YbjN domain-containing protein [Tengunoibacter tsumagoiensis]GCE13296.1 hypothetical protein KTT_31550 [Tengunoibacter tsumagoiensis]
MARDFGVAQILDYLTQMDIKVAHVDRTKNIIELAFHGESGQWRLVIGTQQSGPERKLMLIAPHIGTVTNKKRLECLEALMAVNYSIAIGKFGLDLEDGEVRLEEAVPLAEQGISFEQFQLVFGAIVQTASMYHSLLPRIIYGHQSIQEAIQGCEHDFFQHELSDWSSASTNEPLAKLGLAGDEEPGGLDVQEILAEVHRIFEQKKE